MGPGTGERWEAGTHAATSYGELLRDTFHEGPVVDVELLDRLDRSDLTTTQIEETRHAIDGLCVRYTTNEPRHLLNETWIWLRRLDRALSGRLTLAQHRHLVELAGWAALLAGNLAYDLNDLATSRRARELGIRAGHECGHLGVVAWGHELATWSLMGDGQYPAALERGQAGQQHARRGSAAAHLARHEAEIWAALGDRAAALRHLERAATIADDAPPPDVPNHHFQKDKDQHDKVAMSVAVTLGDNHRTIELAETIERRFTGDRGEIARPMRVAKARATRATALARSGELAEAAAVGISAFEVDRLGIPEILRQTAELENLLANAPGATELRARRRALQVHAMAPPDRGT